MCRSLILFCALFAITYACDKFPNGTDTTLNWFQSCSGNTVVYDLHTTDKDGNEMYPIHLGQPLYVHLNMTNSGSVYNNMNLDTYLWSWGGWTGCSWHSIPTLGLLNNQKACDNGVPCPIPMGNQMLTIVLDFTKYESIINLLTDDAPYQLQQIITDPTTGDKTCVTVQARARIH